MPHAIDIIIPDADTRHFLNEDVSPPYRRVKSKDGALAYRVVIAGNYPKSKHYRGTDNRILIAVSKVPESRSAGEAREEVAGKASTMSWDRLKQVLGITAACALFVKHWPDTEDAREAIALAVAKLLSRYNLSERLIGQLLRRIAARAHDPNKAMRAKAARVVRMRLARGEPVDDLPALRQHLGEAVADKLAQWLVIERDKQMSGPSPTGPLTPREAIARINQEHALVLIGGQRLIVEDHRLEGCQQAGLIATTAQALELKYAHLKVEGQEDKHTPQKSAAAIWLEHPEHRQFRGVVFEPQGSSQEEYNLYLGLPYQSMERSASTVPIRPSASLSGFEQYTRRVICEGDDGAYSYLMAWMAHLVQRPAERNAVALVLRGFHGSEQPFVQEIGKLCGAHFLGIALADQIRDARHPALQSALLVHLSEDLWAQPKGAEQLLHTSLQSAQTSLFVNGTRVGAVANHKRLILSVEAGWTAPKSIPQDTLYVLDGSQEPAVVTRARAEQADPSQKRAEDGARHTAPSGSHAMMHRIEQRLVKLFGEPLPVPSPAARLPSPAPILTESDRRSLMQRLLAWDLSLFSATTVPVTRSDIERWMRVWPALRRWWYGVLCAGRLRLGAHDIAPFGQELAKEQIFEAFKAWCADNGCTPGDANAVKGEIGKLAGAETGRLPKTAQGERPWSYRLPSLEACRAAFVVQAQLTHIPPDMLWPPSATPSSSPP